MRNIFFIGLMLFCKTVFCQDSTMIKEINKTIAPFVYDTLTDDKYYVLQTKGREIIIVNAHKESSDNNFVFEEKVFVFEKHNDELMMIDSSARFGRQGKGVFVFFSKDTILFTSNHHGGGYDVYYVFNPNLKKYFLQLIEYREGWYAKENHFFSTYQNYNLATQKLFYKKEEELVDNSETIKTEQKILNIPLPKNLKLKLADFVDPELADGYNKIFQ